MISELSKSIKATLYDRVASPVSGMFLLTWGIWNWKLCLILFFADYGVDQKIATVSASYINTYDNIVCPLVSTTVLVFLYPLVSVLPTRVWEWANAYKSKVRHSYSLEVPLTLAQSITIRQEIQQEKLQLNGIVDEFRLRYESEKATATELGQQAAVLQDELTRLKTLMSKQNNDEKLSQDEEFDTAFSISMWSNIITERIMQLKDGDRTTLKELVPPSEWINIPDTNRKMLGKQFKHMVDRGDFIGLNGIPEKSTSNEQLYVKSQ